MDKQTNWEFHRIRWRLDYLIRLTTRLIYQGGFTMALLDALTEKVTKLETVEESAIALLNELSALIRANATDPAALKALADRIDSDATKLADAVTANTPAPPSQ